jgi:hypothetical protein
VSREQLTRRIRSQLQSLLHDESGDAPVGVAIYTLSDPRDVRDVRYVGQTRSPRRRLLQHVNTARLWLLVIEAEMAGGQLPLALSGEASRG